MNNPNRCGKIARLPKPIREEINRRLEKGATAKSLVPWLNDLPEVQTLVQAEFDGHPVSEHNLSQWKNGGYQDWLRYQEALVLAEYLYERGEKLKTTGQNRMRMSEVFQLWLNSRYVVSTKEIESMNGEQAWKKQRQMCDDLMKMHRAEHRAEQLKLERERLELLREKVQLQRERAEAKRVEKKRGSDGSKATVRNDPAPKAGSEPGRRWEDFSDEEKIAWARRPENLQRIDVETVAQRTERIRQPLAIPREKSVCEGDDAMVAEAAA
ncbi:MAG: hypothetical protein ABJF10_08270 [Chthoniobacter sp.]|uniref:hypothetical protein n=1 Tax=Chthoniobacter sp. TaxID=2510640 RepID=UPI0032A7785B